MVDFARDLWAFIITRKKFWLVPTIVILLTIGFLLVAASGSTLAPFIYTLF